MHLTRKTTKYSCFPEVIFAPYKEMEKKVIKQLVKCNEVKEICLKKQEFHRLGSFIL